MEQCHLCEHFTVSSVTQQDSTLSRSAVAAVYCLRSVDFGWSQPNTPVDEGYDCGASVILFLNLLPEAKVISLY